METETLTIVALAAAGTFFLLLSIAPVYRWAAQQFWEARQTALERRGERMRRECEAEERERDAQLAAMGRALLDDLAGPPYRTLKNVFGQLATVRTGLARYGDICFRVLHATAGSYTGFPSAYELADQDGYRKRAQLQVISTAAAGLDMVGRADQKAIFDPSLVAWRINLERVQQEICPNCPVVSNPERYPDACPVMLMAGGGSHEDQP